MGDYYVYAHFTQDTNECFYIGVGKGDRGKRKSCRNEYWKRIVAKHGYVYKKLITGFEDRDIAVEVEVLLQLLIKPRACLQYGDTINKVISEDTKLKISNKMSGRKLSPDHITKISKSVSNCSGESFESIEAAAKAYNIKGTSGIIKCCKGERFSAGKYLNGSRIKWKYNNNK